MTQQTVPHRETQTQTPPAPHRKPHRNNVRKTWRVGVGKLEISAVWRPRILLTTLALAATAIILGCLVIGIGQFPLSPARVAEIIATGQGSRIERLVVFEWRMPRALAAIAVGCALGLAGALMQSITRNPLASPDILGITSGASAMAVTIIVLGPSAGILGWFARAGIPVVAFIGALLAGLAIWALSWRRKVDPFRMVLFGIVISALLSAYTNFLMVRADIRDATAAQFWLTGSLSLSDWGKAVPASLTVLCAAPLLGWISFQLLTSALGTDVAQALGQRLNLNQFIMLGLSIALSATAVAAAGPIGFLAFVEPQIARALCASPLPPLFASAFSGAVLLLAADITSQALLPTELPVGIITSAIGGVFLLNLLIQRNRKATTA